MIEKSNTLIFRYLLLALLPAIAYTIYLTGQNYDPGLIDFKKNIMKERALGIIPENIGDYRLFGNKRNYRKDNLYEYINGHAEYFISGGFKSLTVAEYIKGEGKAPQVVVDIYDMGEAVNAFGVLMDETSEDAEKVEVGFMGFMGDKTLTFIKGPFFIKVSAFSVGANVKDIAEAIDKQTKGLHTLIPQFDLFPKKGKIEASQKFVKENYRGLGFLSRVFEVDYRIGKTYFQAALISGERSYIDQVSKQYLEFLDKDGIGYLKKEVENGVYYRVNDPFEGEWVMLPLEETLYCLYGDINDEVIRDFTTNAIEE